MSAINGIFIRRGSESPTTALAASLRTLKDLGPDGSRQWVKTFIGLGHQKTADLPEDDYEDLPLYDPEADLAITADVRLHNRQELCEEFALPSPDRQRISDSRLILLAWQKWGRACPDHLFGDFAFAIWDAREQTLFCSRDHIGVRPFFYCLTPDRFVLASSIRGVISVPGVSEQLDEKYIAAKLSRRVAAGRHQTYLLAVHRLLPGHSLVVQAEREQLIRWWAPENAPETRFSADADYAEAAREIVVRSVSDRLRTTHAVGVHLSGGLDSSSVAVLAAREHRRLGKSPPAAFCWQPPPDNNAPPSLHEHTFVQTICEQEGLALRYCPVTLESILAVLQKDAVIEPITKDLLPEAAIQEQAAQQGIRLILSGLGGDEGISFNGRGYHADLLLRGRWRQFYKESLRHDSPWRFIAREVSLLFSSHGAALGTLANRSWRDRRKLNSFINRDFARQFKESPRKPFRQTSTQATLLGLWEPAGHFVSHLEAWGAYGGSRGIRYACPLLDRRLLEFVAGLPPEQFVNGMSTRWLMRRAMHGVLPHEMLQYTDKRDTARLEHLRAVSLQALPLIRRQLESGSWPARARYVDMQRLLKSLRPESVGEHKLGRVISVLLFLDL